MGYGAVRPSGEKLGAFCDHKCIAAKRDGDVTVPPGESSPFEVIETEFSHQFAVDLLGSVAFRNDVRHTFFGRVFWERSEVVLDFARIVRGPRFPSQHRTVEQAIRQIQFEVTRYLSRRSGNSQAHTDLVYW